MFKLDRKSILIGASVFASSALLLTGCLPSSSSANEKAAVKTVATVSAPSTVGHYAIKNKTAIDGGVTYIRANGVETAYAYNQQSTKGVGFGRPATANEIKAWDVDALPDGTGLPEGEGSVEQGDELYEAQCASCHGDFGAGGKGYPQLTGGNQDKDENGILITLKNQRVYGKTDAPKRTVGTYWPKATTLFTYIRDAMPYATPKSLSADETYAITAYILAQNGIKIDGEKMGDDYVLDAEKLAKVVLPNNNGFYPNIDGPTGPEDVRAFFADRAKNIGAGTRCMTDCKDPGGKDGKTEAGIEKIKYEMSDVVPPYTTVRDLPPEVEDKTISKAEKMYNQSCKLCHATDNMGAPAVGDINAWNKVREKGFEQVLRNSINGVGGMPPKGGNEDLLPSDVKEIVDFMIDSSREH
ncbi:Sulfur oxidation protein, cytochrome c subunit [Sulfurimonas gotlandica GD1]|uniref:Sulfur oxidation protein, cytochrome c subunit n=1 Tax=Sulfurimonas gotlandica (strain DSM 19862 / JCM 16533 / GD1) TaxID=929558 RepID=B6BGQ7_SULGG|nr:c-type cytochrome [Sulfurimonas gotlandica]EDZ63330.1 cytochrome c, class I [Sulfurimonas gotlandica GD1]EHP29688.1 Sulfur oxidation protein, cytochrome c subunit [Sulfurimonas gotlandica GD1]